MRSSENVASRTRSSKKNTKKNDKLDDRFIVIIEDDDEEKCAVQKSESTEDSFVSISSSDHQEEMELINNRRCDDDSVHSRSGMGRIEKPNPFVRREKVNVQDEDFVGDKSASATDFSDWTASECEISSSENRDQKQEKTENQTISVDSQLSGDGCEEIRERKRGRPEFVVVHDKDSLKSEGDSYESFSSRYEPSDSEISDQKQEDTGNHRGSSSTVCGIEGFKLKKMEEGLEERRHLSPRRLILEKIRKLDRKTLECSKKDQLDSSNGYYMDVSSSSNDEDEVDVDTPQAKRKKVANVADDDHGERMKDVVQCIANRTRSRFCKSPFQNYGTCSKPICVDPVKKSKSSMKRPIHDLSDSFDHLDDEIGEEEEHEGNHEEDQAENEFDNGTNFNLSESKKSKKGSWKFSQSKKKVFLSPEEISHKLLDGIWFSKEAYEEHNMGLGKENLKEERNKTPWKFSWGPKEPPRKPDELDRLWEEMDFVFKCQEMGFSNTEEVTLPEDEPATPVCQHQFVLDEQIGIICRFCHFLKTEIRYVMPPLVNPSPKNSNGKYTLQRCENSVIEDLDFGTFSTDSCEVDRSTTRTVWNVIPELKAQMYKHQIEGFEFLWKNIAGGIVMKDLKPADSEEVGGCLIAHDPGTGKTFLIVAFLQAFLRLFPDMRPLIVAPSNILNIWEREFKKWEVDLPFHNLKNETFSGLEDRSALDIFSKANPNESQVKNLKRLVKIFSWNRSKSVLAITYNLFYKYTKCEHGDSIKDELKKLLLERPGLLILDEGHNVRSEASLIWQCLLTVRTKLRIMLSGTPFQNSYKELFNVLYLVRPKFADSLLPHGLPGKANFSSKKKVAELRRRFVHTHGQAKGQDREVQGSALREKLVDSFVHIHKVSERGSLPGLKHYLVFLHPSKSQKEILDAYDSLRLEYVNLLTSAAVHPLLYKSVVKEDHLGLAWSKCTQEDLKAGAKLRFVIDLISFCKTTNEKVLIFCEYLEPLSFVQKQLICFFNWTENQECFLLKGDVRDKERQSIISSFNGSGRAKVLLVSKRACSEGISLIGASRVVLIDPTFNPAMDKQAIARAYRQGQKKVVYAYHLLLSGTYEEKKYSIHKSKNDIAKSIFSATKNVKQPDEFKDLDDKILCELKERDKDNSLFDKIEIVDDNEVVT